MLDLVMRQDHHTGEKLFLDFAGHTVPIVDPETGEIWRAQLFLAVLGASNGTCRGAAVPGTPSLVRRERPGLQVLRRRAGHPRA